MNSNSLFQDSVDDCRLKQLFAWITSIYDSLPAWFFLSLSTIFLFLLIFFTGIITVKVKDETVAGHAGLSSLTWRTKSITYNEVKARKCDHKHQNHCTVHYEIDLEKKKLRSDGFSTSSSSSVQNRRMNELSCNEKDTSFCWHNMKSLIC